jgi:diguanylate cyclase (GGDEF)-like protein/PAS domain S-box-containing protein
MAQLRHLDQSDERTIPGILVAAGAIGLIVVALVGWTLWTARQDASRRAATSAENLSVALARALDSEFQSADESLLAIVRALGPAGDDDGTVLPTAQTVLDELKPTAGTAVICVTDETGRIVATTEQPLAGGGWRSETAPFPRARNTFQSGSGQAGSGQAGSGAEGGLVIDRAFADGDDAQGRIALTRRLRHLEGRSGGVVTAMLPLDPFRDLAARLNLGPSGAVILMHRDGSVIARASLADRASGLEPGGQGPFQHMGAAPIRPGNRATPGDNGESIAGTSHVGALPLLVTVALSTQAVFAEWRIQAASIGGVTLALVGALLAGAVALHREGLARAAAEEAARGNTAQFRLLAENSGDIILRLDRHGVQRYVSPAVTELLGRSPSALLGHDWRLLAETQDRPALDAAMVRLRAGAERAIVQYRCRHECGHVVWVEASLRLVRGEECGALPGEPPGAIANIRDVTWRKQAEDELADAAGRLAVLAATDGLTGLANRRSFDETLLREWRRALRGTTHLALLLLDVDWFKTYNDQYGHQRGDDALRAVSACIAETLKRPGDFGARYGGEEFAMVLPGNGEAGATQVAAEIRSRLADLAVPHAGTPSGFLTVSIGIATLIVQTDGDPADLLATADAALYAAKRAGRDRVVTYLLPTLALAAD